jgi:hypothetical protein
VPLIVQDDVETAADYLRPMYALYFGGMGAKSANFHRDVPARMGYEDVVDKVQELYLAGKKDEAAAAIPTRLVEELALIGPPDKIRHDLEAWRDSVVTTLLISGPPEVLRAAAKLVLGLTPPARRRGGACAGHPLLRGTEPLPRLGSEFLRRGRPAPARSAGAVSYSHSIVPGGFDVMSRTTRLTSAELADHSARRSAPAGRRATAPSRRSSHRRS